LRPGTLPVPLCVGLGWATELVGQATERDALAAKSARLWDALHALDDRVIVNGPPLGLRHPGNLNVRFPGLEAEDLLAALQPHLAASTGSACTSGTPEASHVLRGIGLSDEQARSSIRFSVGRFTTDEEIKQAAELVGAALMQLQSAGMRETV
jgi:cysteine desulfurase